MLSVCQLLCFPFALDVDDDLLGGVLADFVDSEIAAHLLQVHGKLLRHKSRGGGRGGGKMASLLYSNYSVVGSSRALPCPWKSGGPAPAKGWEWRKHSGLSRGTAWSWVGPSSLHQSLFWIRQSSMGRTSQSRHWRPSSSARIHLSGDCWH